jgi:hypothetical protein
MKDAAVVIILSTVIGGLALMARALVKALDDEEFPNE